MRHSEAENPMGKLEIVQGRRNEINVVLPPEGKFSDCMLYQAEGVLERVVNRSQEDWDLVSA